MTIKIKTDFSYCDDTGIRFGKLRIGKKTIDTPIKSLELAKLKADTQIAQEVKGINEIYRTFKNELAQNKESTQRRCSISNYLHDGKKDSELAYKLNSLTNFTNCEEEVNISFMGFEEPRFPTPDELRFLATRSYCYSSDVVPFPILTKINDFVDVNNIGEYLSFLENAHHEYSLMNNKAFMGILPMQMGQVLINKIIDFYIDHGINAFACDFGGSTFTTKYTTVVDNYKMFKEYEMLDNAFFYSVNVNPGRTGHDKSIINAKDILGFGYGFDVLGRSQLKAPFNKKGKPPVDLSSQKLRLFDKESYGYCKVIGGDIESIFPSDSSVPLDQLKEIQPKLTKKGNLSFDTKLASIFNIEQMGLEAKNLRIVHEDSGMQDYLSNKNFIEIKDFKHICNLRRDINIKQSNLLDF
jgi:hypothetical protein